jgi:hypothetical protein
MSLQHPDYAEVFIRLRPMDAHRHQFKMLTRGGFSLQQSWIPSKRGRNLATVDQRDHQFIRHESNETGLMSSTSISKMLMLCFREIVFRSLLI